MYPYNKHNIAEAWEVYCLRRHGVMRISSKIGYWVWGLALTSFLLIQYIDGTYRYSLNSSSLCDDDSATQQLSDVCIPGSRS